MTRTKRWILVASTVGLFLSSGITVQVQAADMFVNVGGTVRNNDTHPDGGNTERVVLAASGTPVIYGNAAIGTIEISALQAGAPAMVERFTDDGVDIFALHNVKIRRISGPVTSFPINFWGTAQIQPASPPSYRYELVAIGLWGAANNRPTNSSLTFKTDIFPSGGAWTQYQSWTKSITCPANPALPCTPFSLSFNSGAKQSSGGYNLGTNPRDLRGRLTIRLSTNNDTLSFNNLSGASAKSGAPLDCDWAYYFPTWLGGTEDGTCEWDEDE